MSNSWTILHGGALGDLVLTLELARRLPGADALHVVSRVDPGDLTACGLRIQRRSSEGVGLHWLFGAGDTEAPEALRDLIAGARVLNALGDERSGAHARLRELGAAEVYSFDPRPGAGDGRHIVEQWAGKLAKQGLSASEDTADTAAAHGGLPATDTARRAVAHVVVHPGSGGRAKCWPLASFLETARILRHANVPVVFVLGPAEVERWTQSDLAATVDALASEFPVLRAPEPNDLLATLCAGGAYLGNDSGPTHLTAFLGTPVVALFGPTAARVWRPLGPQVRVLAGDPAAGPRWGLSSEEVAAAVLHLRDGVR